jgi:hypothetical protein
MKVQKAETAVRAVRILIIITRMNLPAVIRPLEIEESRLTNLREETASRNASKSKASVAGVLPLSQP